jgi:hypothetical protein
MKTAKSAKKGKTLRGKKLEKKTTLKLSLPGTKHGA